MTFTKINDEIAELRHNRKVVVDTYQEQVKTLDRKISKLIEQRDLIEDGLNENAADAAVNIIEVRNSNEYYTKECVDAVNEAIEDLRRGGKILKQEYIGVKSYAGWNSQGITCEHFMGPRHGSVWFRVELKEKYWKQDLTENEAIACIQYLKYYLKTLEKLSKHNTTD